VSIVQLQEKFEDTKGIIRSHKSKKDRQSNCQKEKDQKDRQWSIKYYSKSADRATRTLLKTGMNSSAPDG